MTNNRGTIYVGITALLSLAYVLTMPLQPYPFSVVAKMLPCLCLAVACGVSLEGRTQTLMVMATILSAIADAAITFAFEAGLAIFLCVQLTYCAVFFRRRGPWRQRAGLLAVIIAFFIAALLVLLPRAGDLAIAVAIYMSAISLMVILAAIYQGSLLVILGALSFMVSDTLIGVDRFWMSWPAADLMIMTTYYLGQAMIAWGVITTETEDASQ
jgi:uncharacterized membrane protein YhhN